MSDKQTSSSEVSSSFFFAPPEYNQGLLRIPQEESSQASGSELQFSSPGWSIPPPVPIGSQLSVSPRNRYGSKTGSGYLACGRDTDMHSASQNISDERLENIANKSLTISGESSAGGEYSDRPVYFSRRGISVEYYRLYSESTPENYDFAMNIMAYIELLNDSSWRATISYFDENIKRLVQYIWIHKKDGVNNSIDFQNFHSRLIKNLIVDFTEWSLKKDCDFGEFLNCCVIMCQIGAISRIHGFEEVPLFVIGQLRKRIKCFKLEDFVQIMFEIMVKEYADKLVKLL